MAGGGVVGVGCSVHRSTVAHRAKRCAYNGAVAHAVHVFDTRATPRAFCAVVFFPVGEGSGRKIYLLYRGTRPRMKICSTLRRGNGRDE